MAPRGDISRLQRWDPDGKPWEGYTGGLRILLLFLTLSFFAFFLSRHLKFPKRASVGLPVSVGVAVVTSSRHTHPDSLSAPRTRIQSVSKRGSAYLMIFIYPSHLWVLILTPFDVPPRLFTLSYTGGFMVGFKQPLTSYRGITGNLA